jgi:CubicO group peptidase (beta-lactamase class C family)
MQQAAAGLLLVPVFPPSLQSRIRQANGKLNTDIPADLLIAKLTKIIAPLMNKSGVPGLSIALVRDARIIWSQGFGIRSTVTGEPVNTETVFEAASLSKPAFAYVVLKLCESGKLGLDAPLTEYLPDPFIPDEPRLKLITARMVLSHSSGFSHVRPAGTPLRLSFAPGKEFSYSAPGYQYLQIVIERLTNQPLAELMKSYLLKPLGMNNSSFGWVDRFEQNFAQGHNRDSKPGLSGNGRYRQFTAEQKLKFSRDYPEARYPGAAAGMYTTATDFAKFMIEIMQPSKKNAILLSERAINEMLRPQIKVEKAINMGQPTKGVSWGLGWGLEHTPDGDAFWHWGDWFVFRNFAVAFKRQKLGVVILTNSAHGSKVYTEVVKEGIGGTHPAFDFLSYQQLGF